MNGLGLRAHQVPVELVDQPLRTEAAAGAPQRGDARVGPGRVQVGEPLRVGAGQEAVAGADVWLLADGEAESAHVRDPGLQQLLVDRPRRRDHRDEVARRDRAHGLPSLARLARLGAADWPAS